MANYYILKKFKLRKEGPLIYLVRTDDHDTLSFIKVVVNFLFKKEYLIFQ